MVCAYSGITHYKRPGDPEIYLRLSYCTCDPVVQTLENSTMQATCWCREPGLARCKRPAGEEIPDTRAANDASDGVV